MYDFHHTYMYAVFKVHSLLLLTEFLSVIRNLKYFLSPVSELLYLKPLITGKTSYHNSTSLLNGVNTGPSIFTFYRSVSDRTHLPVSVSI